MLKKEIVPTILTSDPVVFRQNLFKAEKVVPRVQIDVIDGVFSQNKTVSLEILNKIDHSVALDLHLMVKEPINWLEKSLLVMADRVVGQIEAMSRIDLFLQKAFKLGMKVGLALDLETPVEKISSEVYLGLDLVLVMAVRAGFGGQTFSPNALKKIKKVKSIVGDSVPIGVDGGLNKANIVECKEAGADIFYLGKVFWEAGDLGEQYQELRKLVS